MSSNNYTYGLQQQGHFIPRAMITFEHFKGCFIVIRSKIGLSNYFGSSSLYSKKQNKLDKFTESWGIRYNPDDADWKILAEIFDRKRPLAPEKDTHDINMEESLKKGYVVYYPNENDLFFKKRDEDIEAYIDSKLGWR